jgi:hypothetical protein
MVCITYNALILLETFNKHVGRKADSASFNLDQVCFPNVNPMLAIDVVLLGHFCRTRPNVFSCYIQTFLNLQFIEGAVGL